MLDKKMETVIVRYLSNSESEDDMELLETWINQPGHLAIFKDFVKANYLAEYHTLDFDTATEKQSILHLIKEKQSIFYKRRRQQILKYAAAAVILLVATLTILLIQNSEFRIQNLEPIIVNNQIEPGTNKATLTLEDGKVVTLEKGTTYQTANATSNGEEIIYQPQSSRAPAYQTDRQSRDIAFNTLTIPRGGQYYIVLADGTKVWLNSESQIRYPIAFTDGQTRQVDLIYGEAYFDVSPSTAHGGSNFKVFNNNQEVEVLGTEFNIKAYKDETNIYTTLVEGKVAVNYSNKHRLLAPTEQSNLDLSTNSINIATVDVYREISWKDGVFSFRNKSLKEIMKVLSRWYDSDVVFENKELENIRFRGSFSKGFPIEDILIEIKSTGFINNYEINKKTITIK